MGIDFLSFSDRLQCILCVISSTAERTHIAWFCESERTLLIQYLYTKDILHSFLFIIGSLKGDAICAVLTYYINLNLLTLVSFMICTNERICTFKHNYKFFLIIKSC